MVAKKRRNNTVKNNKHIELKSKEKEMKTDLNVEENQVKEYIENIPEIKKMDIEEIKNKEINQVKDLYREYLEKMGWSGQTIDSAIRETFFLWDKSGKDMFWDTVLSTEFDRVVRRELKYLLDIRATKGVDSRFGDYLFQIQHFRQYVISEFDVEKLELKKDYKENREYEKKYSVDLPTPSNEQVLIYLSKQKNIKEYYYREKAMEKLFQEMCVKNETVEDILIKVSSLNNVFDIGVNEVFRMVKHIESLDVDSRLKVGDITLVMDISRMKPGKITKNCFSLASKFCGYHKPEEYPMYNEYTEEILKYYRDKDGFSKFSDEDIRDYVKYKGIIMDFRKFYNLEKYDFLKLGQYMAQLGREFFEVKFK